MPSKRIFAFLASAAIIAASFSTSASAAGHGGGHGGGGHGGGGHGGGGFHAGGFRGVGGHAFAGHAFAGHAFAGHAFTGHRFAAHGPATPAFRARIMNGREFNRANSLAGRDHLAHNELAGAHFRGFNTFNHAGFNRNAFGAGRGWDRWGGRFWGAGWNRWGWGFGGWVGPVFWPFLYGDIFSFALWPHDYYDPFWAFGPDFVLGSVYAPGPSLGEPTDRTNNIGANLDTSSRSQATPVDRSEAAQSCGDLAPGVSGLPIEQIRRAIRPTPDQSSIVEELDAASGKAKSTIKQSCPTAIPLTPVARLDTAEKRLEAMVDAIQIVRPPLEKLYASLTAEQKQRFDALGKSETRGA